jgi:hypothetical protein
VDLTIPPGKRLLRIHRLSYAYGPTDFNHTVPTPPGGGRFDTLDPAYGHLYVAETAAGAVAEALMRGKAGPSATNRIVPRAALTNRVMTEVEVLRPTSVVSLRGRDIGHVCQDAWLTKCESDGYPLTREWGVAIRRWSPKTCGFIWWARRDEGELALVLYDDRIAPADIRPVGPPTPLSHGPGLAMVVAILAGHNVTVA